MLRGENVKKTIWKPYCNVVITVRDLEGNILEQVKLKNTIVMVGRKMWRDMLKGTIADGQLKRCAVGDGAAAITDADIKLGNEVFRKAFTAESTPADDEYITTCYITPAEAIGLIEEIGWFAGAAAGAAADSGIMVSRVLWSRNKTALESVQIDRHDTVAEG